MLLNAAETVDFIVCGGDERCYCMPWRRLMLLHAAETLDFTECRGDDRFYLEYPGHPSATFRPPFGHLSATFRPPFGSSFCDTRKIAAETIDYIDCKKDDRFY